MARWMAVVVVAAGMAACGGSDGRGGEGGGGSAGGGRGGGGGGETPVCGDGVLDPHEPCDDGNEMDGDACTSACELAACGDGILWTGVELCDDGNTESGDGCTSYCEPETASFCGDGSTDVGEECDDGNGDDTDACLTTCENARCGDGHVLAGLEECDDSNAEGGDGCSATCQLEQVPPACGDGGLDAGETCDDGNTESGDGCSATCDVETPGTCGDGVTTEGEACDDGNDDETDSCLTTCVRAVCGDGFVRAGLETCDDGNLEDDDGCSALCFLEIEPGCGNGRLEPGEVCDDGNTEELDTCSAACDEERQLEIEVNDDVRWPDAIAAGTVVLASIAGGDVDHFAFLGIAGVTVELRARAPVGVACDPALRPVLSVLDQRGRAIGEPVAGCEDALYFTPATTGVHLVRASPASQDFTPYTLSMF